MGRRETRENAMKLLYQLQIQKEDVDEQISRFMEEQQISEDTEKAYLLDVIHGVLNKQDTIDELLSHHAKGWTVSRMPKVDLAIMRLSTYEMSVRKDIPVNVSINEAVEMAKKYSGEESRIFINGVLGKVWDEISDQAEEKSE